MQKRLSHPMDLPFTIYANKNGDIKYLTGSKLTEVIRRAVINVYPYMPMNIAMLYSCHSIRIWACVLLHEAGMSPDLIKKRLRWLGESYRVYLRDTPKIGHQHNEALADSSQAIIDLIEAVIDGDIVPISDSEFDDSGEYGCGD